MEDESITVNGNNVLAFEAGLEWDIHRVRGMGIIAGGLFNTVFRGRGRVAVACHGTPVLLNADQMTFVDTKAAVAWSTSLTTSLRSTVKAGALIGRGSGEAFQLALEGRGFVLVQALEEGRRAMQQGRAGLTPGRLGVQQRQRLRVAQQRRDQVAAGHWPVAQHRARASPSDVAACSWPDVQRHSTAAPSTSNSPWCR